MAEPSDNAKSTVDSVIEKISEKIHGDDSSSSSSESESESEAVKPESPSTVKAKIFRLFGREKPVHQVLGGGKRKDLQAFRVDFIRVLYFCVCGLFLDVNVGLLTVLGLRLLDFWFGGLNYVGMLRKKKKIK